MDVFDRKKSLEHYRDEAINILKNRSTFYVINDNKLVQCKILHILKNNIVYEEIHENRTYEHIISFFDFCRSARSPTLFMDKDEGDEFFFFKKHYQHFYNAGFTSSYANIGFIKNMIAYYRPILEARFKEEAKP